MPLRQTLLSSLKEKARTTDFWVHVFLYACMGIAFWPITKWFMDTAQEQSRILHALIVLSMATVFLVRFGGVTIREPLTLNPSARRALLITYGLLFFSFFIGQISGFLPIKNSALLFLILNLVSIPAYCCGLASGALFVFGEGAKRVAITASGTLCAFLGLSILMEPLDWPLRNAAGQWSGWVLSWFGKSVELGMINNEGVPQLILLVNQHPFHVASECNGFGVILTSLLIAFLLALYRRLSLFDALLNIMAGVLIGFVFNTVRIVIIVLLAPSLMDHYMLMHEIVGGITYWGCLIAVWLFLQGPVREEYK